ncbi:MAG: hypothetical protein H6850_01620 [Alphaproteobacteria bacterium]|nr:MAG: hypothetical protein H6850_01620 [Alphaproteobacteria bacterium]
MLFNFYLQPFLGMGDQTSNTQEFERVYTKDKLASGINRAYRVLGKYRKTHMQEFHILVMILYDLNMSNFRVREWQDMSPVDKLLKYDLPLTYMDPSDPMIEEFMRMSKEYSKIHLVLLDPKSTDKEIEKEWKAYCKRFQEKKGMMHHIRANLMKAFKINNQELDRWIMHKVHAFVYFEKSFWAKHKNTPRVKNLAHAMIALHNDNIEEATDYFELYKRDEYERLPKRKFDNENDNCRG